MKLGLHDASILGVLWSVAIGEQFYLLWPVILFKLPTKKYWIPFSLTNIFSIIFRAITNSDLLNEHHAFFCIGNMGVGAFGAWLIRKELFFDVYFLRVVERLLISVIILSIILEQNFSKYSFYKMRKNHLLDNLWYVIIIETFVSLIITLLIAKISYRYFETPFLRLKTKFGYIIKAQKPNSP